MRNKVTASNYMGYRTGEVQESISKQKEIHHGFVLVQSLPMKFEASEG